MLRILTTACIWEVYDCNAIIIANRFINSWFQSFRRTSKQITSSLSLLSLSLSLSLSLTHTHTNRDRESGWIQILAWLYHIVGSLDFHHTYKNIFTVHLKHFNFWPSADVKHVSNDLVHALAWPCMFVFFLRVYYYLCTS